MGNNPPPKTNQKISLDDTIIEMRLQAKQIERASKKSQKQGQTYMKKAKQALKKNNEQGAKLYLMSASNKRTQALNYQRTATKMIIMSDRIKSNANNEKLVNTFGNMTHVISQQMNQVDNVKMAESMDLLNQKMDEMMINQKMMEQVMQQNDVVHNNTVDQMMNVLKQQISLEESNKMNIVQPQQQINYDKNVAQNNVNQGMKMQEGNDPFLDQLKDL